MWESIYEDLRASKIFDEDKYMEFAKSYIKEVFGDEIEIIRKHVYVYNDFCEDIKTILNSPYIIHSKQLSSFLEDPLNHIINLFVSKSYELILKDLDLENFNSIINLTIKKCLESNLKLMFQNFVVLSIPYNLHSHEIKIIYPRNKWIILSRKGFQGNNSLSPNYVLEIDGERFSFFVEAPRPIERIKKVRRSSKLSLNAAPRPDIMIYHRWVRNILPSKSSSNSRNMLVKRPFMIIECKEVDGWWKKFRFSKGIMTLTNGNLENVKALDVIDVYLSLYKPKKMFVVSKVKVPRGVKYRLSLRGIETIDDTGFNPFKISELSNYLLDFIG
ncbi:MAG: hypothetical protein QW743_02435 [Candidatus Methanomethylicia archaeon]